MAKKTNLEYVEDLQNNAEVVILNNPIATPTFIRQLSKSKKAEINEVYTPKLFYEIASRLKPADLENLSRNTNIVLTLEIKDFLKNIQTTNTSGYSYLIDSIKLLQTTLVEWVEGRETIVVPIISQSVHKHDSGKIDLYISHDLAKHILQVKETENFSFFKKNVFALQTTRSIKLFPFFSSWKNYGRPIDVDLKSFKEKLGFNKVVYSRFSSLRKHVIDPAIEEINEKTDLFVKYELLGNNLESKKPRVKGIRFWVWEKKNLKAIEDKKAKQGRGEVITDVDKYVEQVTADYKARLRKHADEFYDRLLGNAANKTQYSELINKFQGTALVNQFNMITDVEWMMKAFFRMFPYHAESLRSLSAIRSHIEVIEHESKQRRFLLQFELDEEFGLKVVKVG
ncbi:MAG: RepB family plasmid replication initiator protein [Runella slithyformis]|nr:MAG: RepB family plasmid replication initiator protein [Runella slithyformis]TAE99440.1 MAG: RepB family plasmid replication initiator protein [Runella slithyformis]TAF27537.1 MAG: RepB family plasmid replication initiator protein [Runella slithyformis]TAF46051.1 MAG: RepB family plasmid replication initiator protein [Runella slithyformis]TAF82233.1 MAG: RepB family plasmid replication initiator protein [Runella slithyformis]